MTGTSWARRVAAATAGAGLAVSLVGCATPSPWHSELVTVNAAGTDSVGGGYYNAAEISADGTKVLFEAVNGGFGPADTDAGGWDGRDLYVRDLVAGTTTLVSVNAAGTDSGDGPSYQGGFSADGTKVAFVSDAGDLGPADTNGIADVYVRDLVAGTTSLVTINAAGTDARGLAGFAPIAFSADGSKVAFVTPWDGYGPTDTSPSPPGFDLDVYLRDLTTGTTSLVSANAAGTDSGNGDSYLPFFSPDGTKVAFDSTADDLGPADTNATGDLYLRDLAAGTTSLVSVNASGTDGGNSGSGVATFSPGGTMIAFRSWAGDLGPVDTNGKEDVYLRDLVASTTTLISGGDPAANHSTTHIAAQAVFSTDGITMAYGSYPHASGEDEDTYLYDLATSTTTLFLESPGGVGASSVVIFGAGGNVGFVSDRDDLGPVDTNGVTDFYVHDLDTGVDTLVSARADGTDSGNAESGGGMFSADGTKAVFGSVASDLGSTDTNGVRDVYVATLTEAPASP